MAHLSITLFRIVLILCHIFPCREPGNQQQGSISHGHVASSRCVFPRVVSAMSFLLWRMLSCPRQHAQHDENIRKINLVALNLKNDKGCKSFGIPVTSKIVFFSNDCGLAAQAAAKISRLPRRVSSLCSLQKESWALDAMKNGQVLGWQLWLFVYRIRNGKVDLMDLCHGDTPAQWIIFGDPRGWLPRTRRRGFFRGDRGSSYPDCRWIEHNIRFQIEKKIPSSSDPHPETLFWHSFWHTIWKYINYYYFVYVVYLFWHSIWHFFWHILWESI